MDAARIERAALAVNGLLNPPTPYTAGIDRGPEEFV